MLRTLCLLCLILACSARINKMERIMKAFQEIERNQTLAKALEEHYKAFEEAYARDRLEEGKRALPLGSSFSCHSQHFPLEEGTTSVHKLEPWDVNVIAAMGDSLTAGNGILATNILGALVEYRGRSWSIGGDLSLDQDVQTLPNMLRMFNPNLKGYSTGYCASNGHCANLNVASPGDTSIEMPGQADELIAKLKNWPGVNFHNDWKVITLFIGGNDLCDYCNDPGLYSPDNYISRIRTALDKLHAQVPRAFVNLVEIFDITPVASLSTPTWGLLICNTVTNMVCSCGKDVSQHPTLQWVASEYQRKTEELIASGRYDTHSDFTVVLQPFFKSTSPPIKASDGKPDLSFFSPDCFHFSAKGQYAAGRSLWNNMIEPVGQKSEVWHLYESFHCPRTLDHAHPYFATSKNANL